METFDPHSLDTFKYPNRPAWDRGRKNMIKEFVVSDSEDCVLLLNTVRCMNNTFLYRNRQQFIDQFEELKSAMSKVKFWNDGDIPVGAYSVPVTVAHHMGSLRMYIRTNQNLIRMSYQHCKILAWMFEQALKQLEEWDAKMTAEFGDSYVRMP